MQIRKLKAYQMTICQVFYNKKDLHYLLMTLFTPSSKDNMVAWVAAKSEQLLQRPRGPESGRSMDSMRKILAQLP
jgi:hypothetical protein